MAEDLSAYVSRLAPALDDPGHGGVAHVLPGSLLFVDLSGFTAMSERLATRGRLGAEEVTEVVSSTFAELVGVAWSSGGGLLKFGGDALLLAFTDDGHARRAAHAAIGMRRSLRALGAISTSAGLVRLRMTLGLHSGELLFVLAGDSSRELLVVGPAASDVVRTEGRAPTGGIALSAGAAASLPIRCLGPRLGDGFALARDPGATVAPPHPPTPSARAAARHVPAAVRHHLEEGGGEGEHRQAVVGFIHVEGTDDVVARHGPVELADRLHRLVVEAQAAVDDAGVAFLASDVDVDGAKLIVTAGVPAVRGDDEDRLVHAVRRIVAGDCGLRLRAGIHSGAVFAGVVGPSFRRTYTVMGDTVNTAARIMARAGAGEVLVSPAVLDRCTSRYRSRPTEPFHAKGKRRPMVAHAIEGVADGFVADASVLPLLGRDGELAEVRDALDTALRGEGLGVALVAARGMGSTRLVLAAASELEDVRWVHARCTALSRLTPYDALRQVLRPVLGLSDMPGPEDAARLRAAVEAVDPELSRWLPLLGPVVGVAVEPTADVAALEPRARVTQLQAIVLQVLSSQPPTVLVIDHADEADAASTRLLTNVAPGLDLSHVAVLAVAAAPPAWPCREVHVRPLRSADLAQLCLRAAEGRLLPHEPARIADRAEGNPRLALELVAAVVSGAALEDLPASIERLVASRIDALPARSRQLVRSLSVLGTTFQLPDALAIGGISEPGLSAIADVVERRGDEVRFRSSMVRAAAYAALSHRARSVLHARAAALIEADPDRARLHPGTLAVHHVEGGDLASAWRWSLQAADQAATFGAWVECAASLRRGLHVASRVPSVPAAEVARARRQLAQALWAFGDAAGAETVVGRAIAESDDPVGRGGALLQAALIAVDLGREVAAVRRAKRGLLALQAVDPAAVADDADARADVHRVRVRLLLAASGARTSLGRGRDGLALAEEALRIATETGDIAGQAHAHHYAAQALRALGDPANVERERAALQGFAAVGDLRTQAVALNGIGLASASAGRVADAIDAYREASMLLERIGAVHVAAVVENNVGDLMLRVGRFDEAAAHLEQAALRLVAHNPVAHGLASANLALVRVAQLRLGPAAEALRDAKGLEGTTYEVYLHIAAAEFALAEGDIDRAAAAVAALDTVAVNADSRPVVTRLSALLALACGDRRGGVAGLERSLDEARATDQAPEEAVTLSALAAVTGAATWRADLDRVVAQVGIAALPAVPRCALSGDVRLCELARTSTIG
jgi:class 3 adenylate cyclase/tetratricopeptide (TPR) repeat protein